VELDRLDVRTDAAHDDPAVTARRSAAARSEPASQFESAVSSVFDTSMNPLRSEAS
jgi:hypothetical protein